MGVKKWLIIIGIIVCQLRWMPSDSPGITEYRVYWARNFVSDWQLVGITLPEETTYRLSRKGWYSVTAVNYRGSESDGCESVYYKKRPRSCEIPRTPSMVELLRRYTYDAKRGRTTKNALPDKRSNDTIRPRTPSIQPTVFTSPVP